jgi:hypothetical protein
LDRSPYGVAPPVLDLCSLAANEFRMPKVIFSRPLHDLRLSYRREAGVNPVRVLVA